MIRVALILFTSGACFVLGMATALLGTGVALWLLHGRER